MQLSPKRVKFRKQQRGRVKRKATKGNYVSYGDFGIQSLEPGWVTSQQIEAGRVAISRALAGAGKLYIRIFPHKPVSARPIETRMGKGKGEIEFWAAVVKPGTVLFEVGGINEETAKAALARASHKMPVNCRMVARRIEL
ncbi:MAG: 50S ribosomal protein L16 [Planctomycetes bacterium]|nr:50S ribosomal protein L16 [Planctomycetota bacterium]